MGCLFGMRTSDSDSDYIMSLPHERRVRRMLQWQPFGRGPVGRPATLCASKFEQFTRIKHWYNWKDVAANAEQWMVEVDDFIKFCTEWPCSFHTCFRTGSRPKEGCLFRMRTSDLSLVDSRFQSEGNSVSVCE